MPTLKQITCSLEIGPNDTKLKEYGHRYTDGGVEAFVAVPDADVPFRVSVVSNGYIAPGIAAHVWMDGQYQANRNRHRLQLPSVGMDPREYEVDFKFRQKEEKASDGTFVAREWNFARLQTSNADRAPDYNEHFAKNIGTIEVVIRRCRPSIYQSLPPQMAAPPSKPASATRAPSVKAKSEKAPSKAASAAGSAGFGMFGLFDGGDDGPDELFDGGLDGAYDEPGPHGRYAPSYSVKRTRRPDYQRDTNSGAYRREERYEGRPGRHRADDAPAEYERRRGHRHDDTPAGYERVDAFRARTDVDPGPPAARAQAQRPRTDFVFIEEVCKQIESLFHQGLEEAKKHSNMDRETCAHRSDPDAYLVMTRALQRKAQEIRSCNEEIEDLYKSINACMRKMDEESYHKVRAFLLDKRLLPKVQIELQQSRDQTPVQYHRQEPHQRHVRRPSTSFGNAAPQYGWQEVGRGETGDRGRLPLWQRKQQQQSQQIPSDNQGDWGASPQRSYEPRWPEETRRNDSGCPTPNQQSNDDMDGTNRWATPPQPGSKDRSWGHPVPGSFPEDKFGGQNTGWGKNVAENVGWGANQNNEAANDWGNNDARASNGEWDDKKDDIANDAWPSGGAQKANGDGEDNHGGHIWDPKNDSGDNNQENMNESDHGTQENDWGDDMKPAENNASQDQVGSWGQEVGQAAGGNAGWNAEQPSGRKDGQNAWGGDPPKDEGGGDGVWGDPDNNKPQSKASTKDVWGNDGAQSMHAKPKSQATVTSDAFKPTIKSYWGEWNGGVRAAKPRVQPRDAYTYPASPAPAMSARLTGTASQYVQPGRGAPYAHKLLAPEYLDTWDQPYAVFTFKYRSKGALEKTLKRSIDTSNITRAIQDVEEEHLMRMPKDELVAELMKKQALAEAPCKIASDKPASNGGGGAWGSKPASNGGGAAWDNKSASKPASNGWAGGGNEEVKPSDSVSNDGWVQIGQGKVNNEWAQSGAKGKPASKPASWGANRAGASKQGSGAGNGWANNKAVGSNKGSKAQGGWANANGGGGDGGGGADSSSQRTAEHFGGDPALETTGGNKNESAEWGAAGW